MLPGGVLIGWVEESLGVVEFVGAAGEGQLGWGDPMQRHTVDKRLECRHAPTATAARTSATSANTAAAGTPRRAAVYVRVSLDATGEGLGVQRQEQDARAIIEARGWTLAGVYSDNSISASDARRHRPGYEALRRDHEAGLFDAVIVWDLDRLTRQARQLEDWIDAAEGRGLALVTANGEADLTTDAGRLFARIKAAVARSEVERKSARHRRALQQHAQAGKAPHGRALFGYTTTGEVVPGEAEAVRRVFAAFDAGESLKSLARGLTDRACRRGWAGRGTPGPSATC